MFIHICNYRSLQSSWIIYLGFNGIAHTKLHSSFVGRTTFGNGDEGKGIWLSHLQEALQLLLCQNSRNNALLLAQNPVIQQSIFANLRDPPSSSFLSGLIAPIRLKAGPIGWTASARWKCTGTEQRRCPHEFRDSRRERRISHSTTEVCSSSGPTS